jgi:Lrp/AsnC family transcriptional regulator, regulator for asnA, asnC and gidA
MSKSDIFEKKLLHLLGQNALQNSEELAEQLKVSSATVRRRLKSLINNKLLHIIGVVDPTEFGYPVSVMIAIDVDQDKIESVMDTLVKRKEIGWASTTTGRFDIIIVAWFPSNEYLADFLQNVLGQIEGIRNSETLVCLDVKIGGLVPLPCL